MEGKEKKSASLSQFSAQMNAVQVLCRISENRKPQDLKNIENVLSNVEFIKRMRAKLPETKFKFMLQSLKYRYHRKDEFVFRQGEEEDNFYLLMNGTVEILLNKNAESPLQTFKKIKELHAGDSFGEVSLAPHGGIRKYAARCLEECHFAFIDRKDFHETIIDIRSGILRQIDSLKANSIFQSGWNQYDLMRFAMNFNIKNHPKDTLIFKEGDNDTWIYFIKSGEIQAYKRAATVKNEANNDNQKEIKAPKIRKLRLSLWKEDTLFGDEEFIALKKADELKGSVYTIVRETTAVVISSTAEVWAIDARTFLGLLQEKEEVYEDFVNVSTQKSTRRTKTIKKSIAINEEKHVRNSSEAQDANSKKGPNKNIDISITKDPESPNFKSEQPELNSNSPKRFDIIALPDSNSVIGQTFPAPRSKSLAKLNQSPRILQNRLSIPDLTQKIYSNLPSINGSPVTERIESKKINFLKYQRDILQKKENFQKKRGVDYTKLNRAPLFTKEQLELSHDNYLFACGPPKLTYARPSNQSPPPVRYGSLPSLSIIRNKTLPTEATLSSRLDTLAPLHTRINTLPELIGKEGHHRDHSHTKEHSHHRDHSHQKEPHHKKNDSKRDRHDFVRHRDGYDSRMYQSSSDSKDSDQPSVEQSQIQGDEGPYRDTKFSTIISENEDRFEFKGLEHHLPRIDRMIIVQPLSKDKNHFMKRRPIDQRIEEIIHKTKQNTSMDKLRKHSKKKKPSLNFHLNVLNGSRFDYD